MSLPGASVVCWRPHRAGMWQYLCYTSKCTTFPFGKPPKKNKHLCTTSCPLVHDRSQVQWMHFKNMIVRHLSIGIHHAAQIPAELWHNFLWTLCRPLTHALCVSVLVNESQFVCPKTIFCVCIATFLFFFLCFHSGTGSGHLLISKDSKRVAQCGKLFKNDPIFSNYAVLHAHEKFQTDRKRFIWAHHVICIVELNKWQM